jgi:putative membrane protein
MGFLVRILLNGAAILFVSKIVPGIEISGVIAALGAGLVLGLVNAVVRPILIFLTFPLTFFTLGLFLFALNAFCLFLTSYLVKGFAVHGFWAALWGSILVSVVSWLLTSFLSDRGRFVPISRGRSQGSSR